VQTAVRVALAALDEHSEARHRNLLTTGVLAALVGAQRAASKEEVDVAVLGGAQNAEVAYSCSAAAREVLLLAMIALQSAVGTSGSAEVQWWRGRGGDEARKMLQAACSTCLESYALEASQQAPATLSPEGVPAHGAHMSTVWKTSFRHAKGVTSALLLLLVGADTAFDMAALHLDFHGLLAAAEAEPATLLPRLVRLCGTHGADVGTEDMCLVQHVMLAYEAGPGMVRPGRLQTLLAAGQQQPATFAAFLQSRPHLLWQRALSLSPPAYSDVASEALKHAACIDVVQGFAVNTHTLASIAKLAAVMGIREQAEPASEAAARAWEADLRPFDNVLVVGKARKAIAALTGRPEVADSAVQITELLRMALDFARTTVARDDSADAPDAITAARTAEASLERVRAALGLGLELLMCAAAPAPESQMTEGALCDARAQIWGLALRCQEGLWGRLASQRETEQALSEQEERTLRGTVFFQLLAVLKDSPVAEQTASVTRMRERWVLLAPQLDLLAQQQQLPGSVLGLVQATANLQV